MAGARAGGAPVGGVAGGVTGGAQPPNVFQQSAGALTGAMGGTAQAMGYQPQMVGQYGYGASTVAGSPAVTAQNVQAGQLANTNLNPYFNPYESQVVGQTMSDIERARQMQANEVARQAQAAGAFGGSRSAILESQSNLGFTEQAARTAAQLRQAGFTNAQQMAQQDIQRRMQADLANQGANLQAGTTTANLAQQAALQNMGALNQAGQFNASQAMQAALANQQAGLQGSQQRLSAAGQLGNLSQQGFGMGQQLQQGMAQQGALQQALQQRIIDAARGQYQGYQDQPSTALGYLASALGVSPVPQTTTTSRQPGLFDYLTLGLSM